MSAVKAVLALSLVTGALASPIDLEARQVRRSGSADLGHLFSRQLKLTFCPQCFSGPFQGGGCNVYRTDLLNQPGAPNCADVCIAEGIRRNCCGPTNWSLEMDGCPSYQGFGLSTCECTC